MDREKELNLKKGILELKKQEKVALDKYIIELEDKIKELENV